MDEVVLWILVVAAAVAALVVLILLVRRTDFETSAYLAAVAVLAVALPGTAGLVTSVLYLLHEGPADVKLPINHDGAQSFLYGTGIAIVTWLAAALLLQRYGRAEQANPIEYERLRSYHALLETRHAVAANQELAGQQLVAAKSAETALGLARRALRLEGEVHPSSRGIAWASQSGYVVARANLDVANRALLEFELVDGLAAVASELRSRIDGSRIPSSAALVETLRDMTGELRLREPNVARVRARLAQVQKTVDEYRDGRRYGLVCARSSLYGPIVLGGVLAYFALGLALIMGASPGQIAAGIAFYVVGVVIGLIRHLGSASAADTKVEEDYGLDDARLLQRPLFSGVAAVGGVVLTTMLVTVAPEVTNRSEGNQAQPQQQAQARAVVPPLAEIFDLDKNRLALLYAAIFGLTPGLLARRLGEAAEKFKVDLRSTQRSEQSGSG
jgi:hypothetical protein